MADPSNHGTDQPRRPSQEAYGAQSTSTSSLPIHNHRHHRLQSLDEGEVVTPLGLESASLPPWSPSAAAAAAEDVTVAPLVPVVPTQPVVEHRPSVNTPSTSPQRTAGFQVQVSVATPPPVNNGSQPAQTSLPKLGNIAPPSNLPISSLISSALRPPTSLDSVQDTADSQQRSSNNGSNQKLNVMNPPKQPHANLSNHRLPTMHDPSRVPAHSRINWMKLHEYLEGLQVQKRLQQEMVKDRNESLANQQDSADNEKNKPFTVLQISENSNPPLMDKGKPSGPPTRFRYYSADLGLFEAKSFDGLDSDDSENSLTELLEQKNFWLDVQSPSDRDMKLFTSIFNIHPLTTEDIQMENTREKFELYKSYYFICYCAFDQNPDSETFMHSFNVYILVYADFILSFHFSPLQSVDNVARRLENLKSYLPVTPHWINYALLDDITDKFLPLIHSIELEVDSIDDLVLVISQNEQADMLRRIANARKRVLNLTRMLSSKSEVLRVLIKRLDAISSSTNSSNNGSAESSKELAVWAATIRDTSLYLGDVQDHAITMVQTLQHADTILTRSHSNYLAQVNIELTQSSMQANDGMAKLTALASILVPLNVITGLWGMNVKVPGQSDYADNFVAFGVIVASLVLFCILGLFIAHRLGFLGKLGR